MSQVGPRLGARLWWGLLPLTVLLWGSGALIVSSLPGLPSSPFTTVALLPVLGFAREVAAAITIGCLVAGGLLCRPASTRVARWALGWGLAWVGLTAVAAATIRADIYAVGPLQGAAPLDLWAFMTEVPAGQALAFQLVAATSAVILVVVGTTSATRWTAVAMALAGAMAPALAGHSSLDGLHVEAAISLSLHIAGVCVWVGGLAVVSALLLLEPERTMDLLPRFSVLALVCVVGGGRERAAEREPESRHGGCPGRQHLRQPRPGQGRPARRGSSDWAGCSDAVPSTGCGCRALRRPCPEWSPGSPASSSWSWAPLSRPPS